MTGPDAAAHEHHADHPVSGSIVALVVAALFTAIFVLMTKGVDTAVVVTAVIMLVWGLVAIWALDAE